ncbi:hypothetical protein EK904_000426 [Melospiza melodia maxima]|nr:hypothetical protein EK904_000426 [Melospiza melodia maxima]
MSNATRAVPPPVAPGTLEPGTAARLASAPPFSAVALLTAAHNTSQEGQQLFLTTTAAQVISGIFVWSALIVTFHQVWCIKKISGGDVQENCPGPTACWPPAICAAP